MKEHKKYTQAGASRCNLSFMHLQKPQRRSIYMNMKRLYRLMLAVVFAAGITLIIPNAAAQTQIYTTANNQGESAQALDGYQLYAENGRFMLYINEEQGFLILQDKEGTTWKSVPDNHMEDPLAQGGTRLAMESLIQVKYSDRLGNVNPINAKTASVKKGGLTCKKIANGALLTFAFPREGFSIPIEIVLAEDYVDVSIIAKDITESEEVYKLTTVSVMPYFGAAGSQAEGYIFVPDGSGAIIEMNRPDRFIEDYSQYVYGREYSTTRIQHDVMAETVRMPVFGIKNADHAMMGIITDGAGRAIANASVNGKRCSYNNAYMEFIYRDSDMVLIEKKAQTVRVLEQNPPKPGRYRIRYFFLEGKDANYVGMAHRFGEWLLGEQKSSVSAVPLYMEIMGGIMARESFLGFPVNRVVPLSTYSDVQEMTKRLASLGADKLAIDYVYWNKDGTGAAIPNGIKPEGRLGGKKSFKNMLNFLKQNGTEIYLDFNFTDMVKSRWGFNTRFDSASSIQRSPALQYAYRINDLKAILTEPQFLLNFIKIKQAAGKVADAADKYDFTGVSANTLGQKVYSDFSGKTVKRDTADKEIQSILRGLKDAKEKQLLSEPNAYAVEYADHITDTPIYSSGYMVETYTVPFYQIALHGRVAMSTPAINTMSDPQQGVLKAFESGIGIKYHFIMKNCNRLESTPNNDIISSLFDDWAEEAAEKYVEIKDVLNTVAAQQIVSHRVITQDVRETIFSGGVKIYVNYGNRDFSERGITVKAGGYTVSGI
ncbi:MAG: DUF5696 domain-containing protein [Oscillospiraceae bacterium]|nr:DUF5696 domain-containing protein [Oscillospiraceae bacterium]